MKTAIDKFQGKVSGYFRQLILAAAYLNIGITVINRSPADASIQLSLAKDIKTESFYLRELIAHSPAVERGLLELNQYKMIAAWSDLLDDLFSCFVNMHFNGGRKFYELKKRTVRLDFSLESDLTGQIRAALTGDFSFQRFNDRVKIIDDILNPNGRHSTELSTIKKHVLIRNSIQHHASMVYQDMLKEMGCSKLAVLDMKADAKDLGVDEQIVLSIPELDALKRALFLVSNEWRMNCG